MLTDIKKARLCVGIDIGTTTISALVYDIDNKQQVEGYTVPHSSYIASGDFSTQSVTVIMDRSKELLYNILDTYNVVCIGVTGQMHGIVYVNENGKAVSDLINWQDKRGDLPIENGESACQRIKKLTGVDVFTGYGLATHYYNLINGLIPEKAVGFVSIMDLFAMEICQIKKPVIHTSVASSFGLFDIKAGRFIPN